MNYVRSTQNYGIVGSNTLNYVRRGHGQCTFGFLRGNIAATFFSLFLGSSLSCHASKRKGGCCEIAAAAVAVSAQDEEPERVEKGPQEAQRTGGRQSVDGPPTRVSKS